MMLKPNIEKATELEHLKNKLKHPVRVGDIKPNKMLRNE